MREQLEAELSYYLSKRAGMLFVGNKIEAGRYTALIAAVKADLERVA